MERTNSTRHGYKPQRGGIYQPRVEAAGERFLLAVSPQPWVTGLMKVEPCRGGISRMHEIYRPYRAQFALLPNPGFLHHSEQIALAADASTLGWYMPPLWGLYLWLFETLRSILC